MEQVLETDGNKSSATERDHKTEDNRKRKVEEIQSDSSHHSQRHHDRDEEYEQRKADRERRVEKRRKEEKDRIEQQLQEEREKERQRKEEEEMANEDDFAKIRRQRRSLPIWEHRETILQAVKDNQVLVIIGETGSGKTTQISQYLYEAGYSKEGRIGITQPRRVGTVTVARRVAEEVGCALGEEVGYTVRFADRTSRRTHIKYMTDGCLLRECLIDPDLKEYSVIILDEAHERSVHTDIMFGLMKGAIRRRPDLKLLITSATLDEEKFSAYFNNCPVYFVQGRTFPVEIFYFEKKAKSDYVDAAIDTVLEIHQTEPQGDILLFLTGQEEIEGCCKRIRKKMEKLQHKNPLIRDLLVLPLYAALPPGEQIRVFEPPPRNTRKLVVATNIAETSLTVNGIVYVVDPGYVKQKGFNARTGMETLQVVLISQVAAQQRAGRAGRTQPGKAYRLYTKEIYDEMDKATVPEIQRTNLANTVLTLKALGIHDVLGFEFLDPPDPFLIVQAMKLLYFLGALNKDGRITELGKQMSAFPLEPSYSRMLLASVDAKCSEEMLALIAMMSIENLFYRPSDKRQQEEAEEARRKLFEDADKMMESSITGDQFLLLHIYYTWKEQSDPNRWCKKYYLQPRHLHEAEDIRNQLEDIMKQQKLDVLSSSRESGIKYERLCNAICTGLFMNTARRLPAPPSRKDSAAQFSYLVIKLGCTATVHPQSGIIFSKKPIPQHVVFTELVFTTRPYMRTVCGIRYEWVEEHLQKVAKLDLNRLIGRDVKDIIAPALGVQKEQQESEEKESEISAALAEKFARKTTDDAVQAARERYLQRKQLQQQQAQKKKK